MACPRRIFLFSIALVCALDPRPWGQTPAEDYRNEARWTRFDRHDGLPCERIDRVAEAEGALWVGTRSGLARFDGWDWTPVPAGDGLPPGAVRQLARENRSLLVGIEGKLFQGGVEGFAPLAPPAPFDALRADDAVLEPDGARLYSLFDEQRGPLLVRADGAGAREVAAPPATPDFAARSWFHTRGGRIFLARDAGLFVRERGDWRLFLAGDGTPLLTSAFEENADGVGLAGIRRPLALAGLWEWDARTPPRRCTEESSGAVEAAALSSTGEAVAVYESGLVRVRSGGAWSSVTPAPSGLARATFLCFSAAGDLYAGADDALYVHRAHPRWSAFGHSRDSAPESGVDELLLGDGNELWAAAGGRIDVWREGERVRQLPPPFPERPVSVTGLARDREGRVWAAGDSHAPGLRVWEDPSWRSVEVDAEGERIGFVHKLRTDGAGRIWVAELAPAEDAHGDRGGVLLLEDGVPRRFAPAAELAQERRVHDVLSDARGALWVASSVGIERFEAGLWTAWPCGARLSEEPVLRLFEGDGGRTWFAQRSSVGWIDRAGDLHDAGLPVSPPVAVRDLALSADGRLWVATSEGLLCRFREAWTRLGPESGLEVRSLGAVVARGTSVIVGAHGGGIFALDLAEAAAPGPRVAIDTPARESSGDLVVQWTARSYDGATPREALQTRWRLDAGAWSAWGDERELTLPGLDPGSHSLEVEALNLFGTPGEKPALRHFSVPPGLLQEPRFLVPLCLLGGAVLLLCGAFLWRQRSATAALKKSVAVHGLLLEETLDPVIVFDAASRVVRLSNARASELFGRHEHELDGVALGDLLGGFDGAAEEELRTSGIFVRELDALQPGGGRVAVEARVHLLGNGLGHAILRDLSERRRAEEERLDFERRLADAQKLDSLGRLAGGVAHDFNNLLMIVGGSAEQASRQVGEGSPACTALARIQNSVARACELTEQLLAFAGHSRLKHEPVDLNALVRDQSELLTSSLNGRARLTLDLAPELPPVLGDGAGLQQVVQNLVLNANDALLERGGHVRATTGVVRTEGRPPADEGGSEPPPPGRYVLLTVEDDGVGMVPEVMARIFDPFFTTKPTGRGLGLAAVHGIVRSLDGYVQVASTPGVGTRFKVLLPISGTPVPVNGEPVELAPPTGGRVLVVDDEAGVRQVLREMLEGLGCEVVEASGGRAAQAYHAEHPGSVTCTFLDLTMPDQGGLETRAIILACDPSARVVLMSGFTEVVGVREGGPVLHKPFRSRDLARILSETGKSSS